MASTCKPHLRLAALFLLAGTACSDTSAPTRIEPTFIEVTVDGDPGSPEEPIPFSSETVERTINVRTLDRNGDLYPFEGDLKLRVRPGRLQMDSWVHVEGGEWTGEVSHEASFGPTRIWVADEGDKNQDTEREPSFATGVTDPVHYAFPTIGEAQRIDDPETNQLAGEFAEFRVDDRQVVVTVVGANGFWVTDLLDGPDSHGSLFVYSFQKPSDEIQLGMRLTVLTGGMQEYLGTTQINFPVTRVADEAPYAVPPPVELDTDAICDGERVTSEVAEAYESSLVALSNVSIPTSFVPGDEDYEDYIEYGQWPVDTADGCRFYIESGVTVPGFYPPDYVGQTIEVAQGPLTQVWYRWIIKPRDAADLVIAGAPVETSGPPAQLPGRSQARPAISVGTGSAPSTSQIYRAHGAHSH